MAYLTDQFRELGSHLSNITERWVPNSWVICMILTSLTLLIAIFGAGVTGENAILAWGDGMWNLLELAMQFTIVMVASHACVSSRPVFKMLNRLAQVPDPDRPLQSVALAAAFSLITAYLNWALCLVASALFVPFLCRHNRKTDIRVLIAAAYLGLGTTFPFGLSSSAPLILATPGNPLIQPTTGEPIVNRLVPVTETLFTSFNLGFGILIAAVGFLTVIALHPRQGAVTLSPEQIQKILPNPPDFPMNPSTPAGKIDRFHGWILLAVILILYPLGHSMVNRGFGPTWTINAYNMTFLAAALLLHRRPISFVNACRQGVNTTWGIILQFPFYAGIFGVMNSTGLGSWLGQLFADFSTIRTFPVVVYTYSAFMNLFVPSAGSKWLIEAPFLIPAGQEMGVSVTTVVLAYAYGDGTTNLIQPFWAIPILAVVRLRFGEIVGYTFLVAIVCFTVNIVAMLLIPPTL